MSRIDTLIAELCPEGVEFSELGALLERTSNIRWQDAPGDEFKYIDLTLVDRNTHAIGHTETATCAPLPRPDPRRKISNRLLDNCLAPLL